MQPLSPDTLLAEGRYRLTEPLGTGGMAEVWRAWDERLSVERAVKVLASRYVRSTSAAVRFEREARVMAKLEHPHVVPVHDIGEEDGRVYLVMSLLDHSLQDELAERGHLPAGRVVRMSLGVLEALHAAHEAGIVHRDVKPDNVLVDERDAPRLTDFGIATDPDAQGLTRTGAIMGTLAYMAPEQRASARRVDARADLYAVGAMVYALCTGADSTELDHPDDRAKRLGALPSALVPFVDRCTRRRPEERFLSAKEALEELQDIASQLPDKPRPEAWRKGGEDRPTGVTMDLDALGATEGHTGPTLRPGRDAVDRAEAPTAADPDAATVQRQQETELLAPVDVGARPVPAPASWWLRPVGASALLLLMLSGAMLWTSTPRMGRSDEVAPVPSPPPEPAPIPVAAPAPEPVPAPEPAPEAPVPAPAPTPLPVPTAAPAPPPPPEPPPTPVAEAPTGPTGSVSIMALPPATLTIDAKRVGSTPFRGELPVGRHELLLDDGAGHTHSHVLFVEEGRNPGFCWDLPNDAPCPR